MARRHRTIAPVPPEVVVLRINDPRLPSGFQIGGDLDPEQRGHPNEKRIEIRVDRVIERRDEEPRPAIAHLVDVVNDSREPAPVEQVGDHLRLDQVQHEPVAIVVVAGEMVVQPRQLAPLVRGAQRAAIPIDHHDLAIGIGRRQQQYDHILEVPQQLRVGYQRVRQLHTPLARSDLTRVEVVRHEDDSGL